MHVNSWVWKLPPADALLNTLSLVPAVQSLSVVKAFGACGRRAVNPAAAWICHVSERVVIRSCILCTEEALFEGGTQVEHLQNVCYWGIIENLTYKYAAVHNQCDVRWLIYISFKISRLQFDWRWQNIIHPYCVHSDPQRQANTRKITEEANIINISFIRVTKHLVWLSKLSVLAERCSLKWPGDHLGLEEESKTKVSSTTIHKRSFLSSKWQALSSCGELAN